MSVYTKTELDKLSIMYDGDKNRDASSKIRGFLFQDYVTIMCLLKERVKYYPNTAPNMKEISTDLYYQYLRFQMLHSTLIPIPSLYIHRTQEIKKPTLDKMKTYIDLEKELPKSAIYLDTNASENWLRKNVYISKKRYTEEKSF